MGAYRVALWGLERLVDERRPEMEAAASATSCRAALELGKECRADVVVVDPDDAREGAEQCVSALIAGLQVRTLVLTGIEDARVRESFVVRGACGIVQKHEPPEVLLKAVRKVADGELWLDRAAIGRLFVQLARGR